MSISQDSVYYRASEVSDKLTYLGQAIVPNDITHREEICMPTQQDSLRLRLRPWLLPSTTDGLHALHRQFVLRLRCPPRLDSTLREIGEEHKAKQSQRQRDNAVNYEQPSPAREAMHTVQVLVRSCLQETTEKCSDRTSEPEYHRSLADLFGSVP